MCFLYYGDTFKSNAEYAFTDDTKKTLKNNTKDVFKNNTKKSLKIIRRRLKNSINFQILNITLRFCLELCKIFSSPCQRELKALKTMALIFLADFGIEPRLLTPFTTHPPQVLFKCLRCTQLKSYEFAVKILLLIPLQMIMVLFLWVFLPPFKITYVFYAFAKLDFGKAYTANASYCSLKPFSTPLLS